MVIPIHKKGDKELAENYRPISWLCILSKVLKSYIFNRLINHLSSSLYSWQHGFLSGQLTVIQMLCFLHKIGQARDNSIQSEIVYLDLSKAFDTDEIRRSSQLRTLLKLVVVSRTWKKFSGPYGIWTHDLCDTGAALYQLS